MLSKLNDSQKWFMLAVLVFSGWLVYLLAPVLTPFLISALLAYLGDPLVDRLEARKFSRTLGVVVVFFVMLLISVILLLVMIPLLEKQIAVLIIKIPEALDYFQNNLLPRIAEFAGFETPTLDTSAFKRAVIGNWESLGGAMGGVFGKLTDSGLRVVNWLAFLVLIPVVTFYLLRDWDLLIERIHDLLPRRLENTVTRLAKECDEVLAEFFRGQLSVMMVLTLIYTVGLMFVGLDVALLIGMISGVVSFVPYLGFIVGIVAASVAALMQFNDAIHLVYVGIVFGIAQALEGMVLSPLLVGDRIGLHPVAVIFAVMAGGQLFGFVGVLLALPVAAVIVVILRHWHELYKESDFYTP
ncbi:MAG: AI-2E family transporter [Gammaproteobacteria bacterium]